MTITEITPKFHSKALTKFLLNLPPFTSVRMVISKPRQPEVSNWGDGNQVRLQCHFSINAKDGSFCGLGQDFYYSGKTGEEKFKQDIEFLKETFGAVLIINDHR